MGKDNKKKKEPEYIDIESLPDCTIEDIIVDNLVYKTKAIKITNKDGSEKWVKVKFKKITVGDIMILQKYDISKTEENMAYNRHMIYLSSITPKFDNYDDNTFINYNWGFIKRYVEEILDYIGEDRFLLKVLKN